MLSEELTPLAVNSLTDQLEVTVTEIIDRVIEQGECDLVWDIAGRLASYVTADLLGLPREESLELFYAADILTRGGSRSSGEGYDAAQVMRRHAVAAWQDRQENDHPGMLGRVARSEILGHPMDEWQFAMDFNLLVDAGSDTTRNVVSGGLLALFDNPDQYQALIEDAGLVPSAVEEALRWTTPIVYQRRTATTDTTIGGTAITRGAKVVSFYVAGNRDPEVFSDPDRFDITRRPNPHLAFGAGRHFCLGSHLARLELAIMFRELARRMPDLRLAGSPRWYPFEAAPAAMGPLSIPVKFTPGPRSPGLYH